MLGFPRFCGDSRRICGDSRRICGDLRRICGDLRRICGDLRRICGDSRRICGDPRRICGDSPQICANSPPICWNLPPICPGSPPICSNSPPACAVFLLPYLLAFGIKMQHEDRRKRRREKSGFKKKEAAGLFARPASRGCFSGRGSSPRYGGNRGAPRGARAFEFRQHLAHVPHLVPWRLSICVASSTSSTRPLVKRKQRDRVGGQPRVEIIQGHPQVRCSRHELIVALEIESTDSLEAHSMPSSAAACARFAALPPPIRRRQRRMAFGHSSNFNSGGRMHMQTGSQTDPCVFRTKDCLRTALFSRRDPTALLGTSPRASRAALWSKARFSGSLQRTKHPTRRALYPRRSARMTANLAAAESFRSICRPLRFQLGRDGPIIDLGSSWRFGSRAHH